MQKLLQTRWLDFKLWLCKKMPWIERELKSVLQSFATGIALYLVANWGVITATKLDKAAILGILIAAMRSGVKVVWAFIGPKLYTMLVKQSKKKVK